MSSRTRIRRIVSRAPADRCGFWLGNPDPASWPLYLGEETPTKESFRRSLQDDFRWISPQFGAYRHPEGLPIFDTRPRGAAFSSGAVFTDTTSVAEVDDFPWPDPDHLDFTATLAELDAAGDVYRASGFWCPFFHDVADFMSMEEYFVKMYTHPQVVHAITRRVVDFYLEANRRFYAVAGERIDGFFFGNDFGAQRDLLISPAQFDEFVRPYLAELIEQGREHRLQIILHSCGSIPRVIPTLIELGVEALHPIQARATGMDAESLAEYRGALSFIGGVDTQDLLVNGTPDEVRADVRRVKELLGPDLVVSPSHEALLPNVSLANVRAMAEEAIA